MLASRPPYFDLTQLVVLYDRCIIVHEYAATHFEEHITSLAEITAPTLC